MDSGFSLVEFIVIFSALALLTGTIAVSVQDTTASVRLSNAATQAMSDLRSLQEIAMNEYKNVSFTVDPGADSYTMTVDGDATVVYFNQGEYTDIGITSSSLGGTLSFSKTGQPMIGGTAFTNQVTVLSFNESVDVFVYGDSGWISVESEDWGGGGCGGGC